MKRTKTQVLLIGLTVLALSAGVVAGLLAARLPGVAAGTDQPGPPPPGPGPIERASLEALQLSPTQREQMRAIWEGTREKVHLAFDQAQELQKQRDDALVALLPDEKKAEFAKISKDFKDRFDALGRQRDDAFRQAVIDTDGILDEGQRLKYREILKSHLPPNAVEGGLVPGLGPATAPSKFSTTRPGNG